MKEFYCTIVGVMGGAIASLLGGFNQGVATLVICMFIDYASGLIVAGVFHASKKTKNGRIQSNTYIKGFVKKIMILALVAVAHRIDLVVGSSYIRDAAVIGFILNEIISIFENAGLMGIKLPSALTNAIEVLTSKEQEIAPVQMDDQEEQEEDEQNE